MSTLKNRYDFVLLFDVINGNPNGDPDAGNLPRMDPETGLGLVSDVSLKRKIRNYIELAHGEEPGHRIYVREGSILNEHHREAYADTRPGDDAVQKSTKLNPKDDTEADTLREFMCRHFFDVRTFGAVMSTGINCGQVRGPVQMTFAQSIEPIVPSEISITRMAATTEKEKKERVDGSVDDERTDNRTMGRKHLVPYGLYRAHGFISAPLAQQTGFSNDDLEQLLHALMVMFESDRSAARGLMSSRSLIVFKHGNKLGDAPAHKLFDTVKISRRGSGDERVAIGSEAAQQLPPARSYDDYIVELDRAHVPESVEVIERG